MMDLGPDFGPEQRCVQVFCDGNCVCWRCADDTIFRAFYNNSASVWLVPRADNKEVDFFVCQEGLIPMSKIWLSNKEK